MASLQSKIFNYILRLINKKTLLKRQFKTGEFNKFSSPKPNGRILKNCNIDEYQLANRNIYTIRAKNNNSKKHILYLHGGAYVTSFVRLHWDLMEEIATNTGCTITAPDYPLAPENTYKEVFAILFSLYQKLLAEVHPENIMFIGDSAGGGIALALAQQLKVKNLPQPRQLILLSPWLDITLSNPGIPLIEPSDPFMGIEGLRMAGKAYAGGDDPDFYQLSPINGSLEGLGKLSVFIGTKEILLADARELKSFMEDKGLTINYYEYKDMIHVWMLLNFPESRKARREIVELINDKGTQTLE